MANSGPDTNGSQFFITMGALPHLDGKHVVVGAMVESAGGMELLEKMNAVGSASGETSEKVVIGDSGEVAGGGRKVRILWGRRILGV